MVWTSPVKRYEEHDQPGREGLACLWDWGTLDYKLDPLQLKTHVEMKEYFAKCKTSFERIWVDEWARRLGKDFRTLLFVREEMRKHKKGIYYYGTALESDIDEILIPILDEIEKDCPKEYKLIRRKTKGVFEDPHTGSILRMVGFDKNPDGIRGKATNGIVVTEYSYCDNIADAETAFTPMLTDSPNAWRIYLSTPGETTTHKWHTEVVPKARKAGGYSIHILDECPRFSKEQIEAAYEEFGGRDTTKSRREYRCEHVSEETKMVVPEWLKAKKTCVRSEYELPKHAHCYVIIDPGQVHLFGFLYLLYDFKRDTVVAQRAYTLRDPTTSEVAESIRESEYELWDKYTYHDDQRPGFYKNPYQRFSDVDLRLIKDLSNDYDLYFRPTKKDDLRSAVNALRQRVASTKYVVLPEAEELVWHFDGGIWDKNKKKFEDVGGELGHFDLLACAVYGERNLDLDRNPLPPEAPPLNEMRIPDKKKKNPFEVTRDRQGLVVEKPLKEIDPTSIWK